MSKSYADEAFVAWAPGTRLAPNGREAVKIDAVPASEISRGADDIVSCSPLSQLFRAGAETATGQSKESAPERAERSTNTPAIVKR